MLQGLQRGDHVEARVGEGEALGQAPLAHAAPGPGGGVLHGVGADVDSFGVHAQLPQRLHHEAHGAAHVQGPLPVEVLPHQVGGDVGVAGGPVVALVAGQPHAVQRVAPGAEVAAAVEPVVGAVDGGPELGRGPIHDPTPPWAPGRHPPQRPAQQ